MSEFFEPPPPVQAECEVYHPPPWAGPPGGTLPGVVALALVLAQTDKVAVCLTRLAAYPTGFEFEALTMSAPGLAGDESLDPMLFGPHRRGRSRQPELPAEMLRLGVQFADGGKATNTSGFYHDGDPPAGPIPRRGRRRRLVASDRMGLAATATRPTDVRLRVAGCWGPLTRRDLDAQTILDAAKRAEAIFPEGGLPQGRRASFSGAWLQQTERPRPS